MRNMLNLSPGPVDFRKFLALEHEGLMIPHWSKAFSELSQRVVTKLRYLLDLPSGDIAFISASGTGALEALLLNALRPQEKVLVVANGFFGERICRMAERLGLRVSSIVSEWDQPFDAARVVAYIQSEQFVGTRAVVAVHLETSTGLLNPLAPIGEALRDTPALFLVDAISSAGPHTISMSAWHIDGLSTVSYKGLLSQPGLSILALSEKYTESIAKIAPPSYYLDLKKIIAQARQHTTTGTVAVNAIVTLDTILEYILRQGKEEYSSYCGLIAQTLRQRLVSLGYQIYGKTGHSHAVTALMPSCAIDMQKVIIEAEQLHGLFIGKGLGLLQNQVVRIGHYGQFGIDALDRLEEVFSRAGHLFGLMPAKD